VGDGGAGAKSGGDVDCLPQFLLGYTGFESRFAVQFNAVRALGGESHGDGHELFVLLGNGSVGERGFVVGPESGGGLRGEFVQFGQSAQFVHGIHSSWFPFNF